MPSTRLLAAALAAMVLVSGCGMLPGGGGDTDTEQTGPDYHGVSLTGYNGGDPFEATVTVESDGEVLYEGNVSTDGDELFENLTTVEASGPLTITVNTTVSGASGNRSDRIQVEDPMGNETVIEVRSLGIYFETLGLPREEMREPMYFQKDISMPIESTIVVSYEGEPVVSRTVSPDGTDPIEVADLPETGVYRVAVSGPHEEEWTNETVIVSNPEMKLFAELDGDRPVVQLYSAEMPSPET